MIVTVPAATFDVDVDVTIDVDAVATAAADIVGAAIRLAVIGLRARFGATATGASAGTTTSASAGATTAAATAATTATAASRGGISVGGHGEAGQKERSH
jgi:hypothetical protein